MIPLFDYGSITEEHKRAAEECAKLIEVENPTLAKCIRERFEIIEPKKLPLEESSFYNAVRSFGITPSQQGYMVDPDGVHIPMIAIFGDVKQLDEFLRQYKNSHNN
jgi:hypothetical protein